MKHSTLLGAAALALACGSAQALVKTYQAPPDTVFLTPSSMPGYAKAKAACSTEKSQMPEPSAKSCALTSSARQ